MSNSIVNVLKNHEQRLKTLEEKGGISNQNSNHTSSQSNMVSTISKNDYEEDRKKHNEEIEKMKEETLYLKDTIHNIMKDYNRLKDLYISHNIEFLRFKHNVLEKSAKVDMDDSREEVGLEIKEKEPSEEGPKEENEEQEE